MHRIGARIWIARIMITWGLLSALFAFVQTPTQFYVLRFLLGLAEAGFYPGVILYLTYWFPSHRRAKIIAVFMSAIPVSGIFGNPLSGWIMERFHGGSGFHGWQWMFMIEAVPAVLVGIATILYLDNSIRSAKWLDEREKQLLEDEIAAQPQEQQKHGHSLKAVFADPRMWWMSLIYFAFVTGQYATFWMPTLVKSTGITDTLQIGLLSAIPFLVAIVVMNLFGLRGQAPRTPLAPDRAGADGRNRVCGRRVVLAQYGGVDRVPVARGGRRADLRPAVLVAADRVPRGRGRGRIAIINSVGNLAGFAKPRT